MRVLSMGSRVQTIAMLILVPAAVWLSWPDAEPQRFVDSTGYVQWPTTTLPGGRVIPSLRPAGYPLTLAVVGVGPALVHFQTWVSLASFGLLGWLLAGPVGFGLAVVIAQGDALALWNAAVLTESLSASGIALAASAALLLARAPAERLPLGPTLFFGATCVYLVLLRDANVLLVPAFALGFARFGQKALVLGLGFCVVLAVGSIVSANQDGRWRINYYTAVAKHASRDAEARELFREAGMPGRYDAAGVQEWLAEGGGRRVYETFVLGRRASYTEIAPWLSGSPNGTRFREVYFEERAPAGGGGRAGNALWWALALPVGLWALIVAVPLLEWWRSGRVSAVGAMAAILVPATYAACFLSFHASGTEPARHLLGVSLLFRIAFIFALSALATLLLSSRRRGADPGG